MKIVFFWMMACLCYLTASAQVPQAFNYQAIARDANGTPNINATISLQISILQGALPGTEIYKEIHVVQTNKLGLFNLEVGHGEPQSGVFENIDWGSGDHYIKTEIDLSGGTNFTLLGETRLLSVPYALFAGNASGPWEPNAKGIHYTDGFVGIGLSNPAHKLTIEGDDDTGDDRTYLNLFNKSTSNRSLVSLELSAGQSNTFTTLQHISETYDVDGDKFSEFGQLESSGRGIILRASRNDGIIKFLAGGNALSPLERMRISANGYIGIGTETPSNLLTMDGDVDTGNERFFIAVNNNSLGNRSFAAMKFTAGAGSTMTTFGHNSETYDIDNFSTADYGGISNNGGGIYLIAGRDDGIIKLFTGIGGNGFSFERMRISADGNIGIGTTEPAAKLQVSEGDVYIEDINNGVIMKSPNGNCWRLTANNDGTINMTSVNCPN